jgi:hypothetical protein
LRFGKARDLHRRWPGFAIGAICPAVISIAYPGWPQRSSMTKIIVGNRRRSSIQAVVRPLVSPSSRRVGQMARPRERK